MQKTKQVLFIITVAVALTLTIACGEDAPQPNSSPGRGHPDASAAAGHIGSAAHA